MRYANPANPLEREAARNAIQNNVRPVPIDYNLGYMSMSRITNTILSPSTPNPHYKKYLNGRLTLTLIIPSHPSRCESWNDYHNLGHIDGQNPRDQDEGEHGNQNAPPPDLHHNNLVPPPQQFRDDLSGDDDDDEDDENDENRDDPGRVEQNRMQVPNQQVG